MNDSTPDSWRNLDAPHIDELEEEIVDRIAPRFEPCTFQLPVGYNIKWMGRGACRGLDPDMFAPERGETGSIVDGIKLAACGKCAVRAECLEFATEILPDNPKGIWGGASENERRKMRSKRARREN